MEKYTPDFLAYLKQRAAHYEKQIDDNCELLASLTCRKRSIELKIADVQSNLNLEREILTMLRKTIEDNAKANKD